MGASQKPNQRLLHLMGAAMFVFENSKLTHAARLASCVVRHYNGD